MKIRWFILTSYIFLIGFHTYAQTTPWQPDISTTAGQLRFLQSIVKRHPDLPSANLKFRRNLLEVLAPVAKIQTSLGEEARSLEMGPSFRLGIEYS
ncbi:MAG: hypothetical protein HYW85_03400, partial [Deltaproteobacteria bacterium]|nr:hypothetical protein [Deltaproteobacteria bacterium]